MQLLQDLFVEVLLPELARHGVDRVGHVLLLDDAFGLHVAEERQLGQVLLRDVHLGAADEDVGEDADVAELRDGVLRGLGLQLARGLQVGHEGQVDEAGVLDARLEPELPRGLQERKRLDVARDAADLAEHDVGAALARGAEGVLDLVRDVGDDLHGAPEVLARALLREHRGVDAARGVARRAGALHAREPLVVAEVEVGLATVVGHEDLAVLVGAHRARVHVEVGVELLHEDVVSAALQQERERGGGDALAERAHDAAGDEDVLGLLVPAGGLSHGALP